MESHKVVRSLFTVLRSGLHESFCRVFALRFRRNAIEWLYGNIQARAGLPKGAVSNMKPTRSMTQEEACGIVEKGTYAVLSMATNEGTPYGVPINYFYAPEEQAIFFHCSTKGRKADYLKENNRVSLVVVGHQKIVPERFVTHYESAVVTGTAHFVTEREEKVKRLIQLCQVLAPEAVERRDEVIDKELPVVMIVRIDVREITGKRNRDI